MIKGKIVHCLFLEAKFMSLILIIAYIDKLSILWFMSLIFIIAYIVVIINIYIIYFINSIKFITAISKTHDIISIENIYSNSYYKIYICDNNCG